MPLGALQEATAASAVFQFFVRDVMGMIGGVVFASTQGSSFDSNAKQWRLFADCLNNVGAQIFHTPLNSRKVPARI